jgi:spore germination protein KB
MQSNVTFPSKRLMLSLFVCSVLPILLMGRSFLQSDNIFSSLASIGFGIFFTLLCFVPFYSIKHRTRLDFSAFAKNTSQTGFFFVSSYYCMYFTVITVSFLIRFCDMFVSGVNPDVDTKVIAFLILCICVYGASKGINPLSRVSIFVLAFLIIAFAVIFFGNIKSFEFAPNSTFVTPDFSNIRSNVADCLIFAFLPVIFGFNSTSTKNLSIKQPVITTLIIFAALMLTLFFADFVIGAYSAQQPFSVQLLSKTAYFGDMKGFDSFYLAAVTACIFVFVTAVLISVSNCIVNTSSKRTLVFVSIMAFIMFVLFVCADSYNAVKELLLNNIFMIVLNFISALLIPIIYLFVYRRKLYE